MFLPSLLSLEQVLLRLLDLLEFIFVFIDDIDIASLLALQRVDFVLALLLLGAERFELHEQLLQLFGVVVDAVDVIDLSELVCFYFPEAGHFRGELFVLLFEVKKLTLQLIDLVDIDHVDLRIHDL